ncbi:MAG: PilZ domain-containing protein [Clostridia bacterium]|nr:PilZ domain-containing protein [Clostridia bacterium]MDD4572036.1 PilZ domain-containing protein [Clostridia bacterium]
MSLLTEQYVLSPCEIKTMENVPLTCGYLKKVTEDSVEIVNPADKLPIIHCNTPVKINIFNSQLKFKILIGIVYLSTPDILSLVELQNVADYEKRNFFRVKVDMSSQAYLIQDDGKKKPSLEFFSIFVKNLSLSGLLFKSEKRLPEGSCIMVNLNLYGVHVSFLSKIIRARYLDPESDNEYGCIFIEQKNTEADMLCKFIFDFQREQIRKMKLGGN